ncbi:alpha/beta fold hydrolase [Desulfospira joergensenii]|uniref:alpha/beta fold hydrolase n=1 Tax=Desulfospira joergensenii TaxID=53329 RepID=UPI0003B6DFDD|nr:alpha/beta hydrolase [Desulfospira joergensenii]
MPIVNTGSVDIAYEESGIQENGVVILIRGQGTQLIHWPESFYETFAGKGYRTIRFDNRDTGFSTKLDHIPGQALEIMRQQITAGKQIDPPYTLDDMAGDVLGLMDAMDIQAAHLVGISMGGYIGQVLAAEHPSRVLSLTSIMSASSSLGIKTLDHLWSEPQSRESFIEDWVAHVQEYGSPGYFEGDDHSRKMAAAAFDRSYSPEGANRQLLAIICKQNMKEQVKKISVPTFVIHGAVDRLISPERGKETADLISGSKFQVVDGMGHDIPPRLGRPLARMVCSGISSIQNPAF